jgi:hypothetical protein
MSATPDTTPSPATAPTGTVLFADWLMFDAAVLLSKGQPVGEVVAAIVLLYVTVAVGSMAVPAARRTVPFPDVQQLLAAASWPQQK